MSRIIALDFETSGLDHKRHAPVSLGLALMDGAEVIDSREWVIGPKLHYKTGIAEREYNVIALAISGLTWKEIKDAPTPAQVCKEIAKTIQEWDATFVPVVAFNSPFDLGWYSELMFMGGGFSNGAFSPFISPLLGPWSCALMLARHQVRGLADYKLDTVADYFGFSRSGEKHGALEDAILAGQIYNALTTRDETGNPVYVAPKVVLS